MNVTLISYEKQQDLLVNEVKSIFLLTHRINLITFSQINFRHVNYFVFFLNI